jgi:hypothetical protein
MTFDRYDKVRTVDGVGHIQWLNESEPRYHVWITRATWTGIHDYPAGWNEHSPTIAMNYDESELTKI